MSETTKSLNDVLAAEDEAHQQFVAWMRAPSDVGREAWRSADSRFRMGHAALGAEDRDRGPVGMSATDDFAGLAEVELAIHLQFRSENPSLWDFAAYVHRVLLQRVPGRRDAEHVGDHDLVLSVLAHGVVRSFDTAFLLVSRGRAAESLVFVRQMVEAVCHFSIVVAEPNAGAIWLKGDESEDSRREYWKTFEKRRNQVVRYRHLSPGRVDFFPDVYALTSGSTHTSLQRLASAMHFGDDRLALHLLDTNKALTVMVALYVVDLAVKCNDELNFHWKNYDPARSADKQCELLNSARVVLLGSGPYASMNRGITTRGELAEHPVRR